MTKEQMRSEIHKANLVIQKLQKDVGNAYGTIAILEVERDAAHSFIQQKQQEEAVTKVDGDTEGEPTNEYIESEGIKEKPKQKKKK